jgi:hypothetical protein
LFSQPPLPLAYTLEIFLYFLGDLFVISDSFIQETMKVADESDVSVVKMEFMLDKNVESGLYKYITEMK